MFSLNVEGKQGPIKMSLEFTPGCAGDIKFEICKDQDGIKEGKPNWRFFN